MSNIELEPLLSGAFLALVSFSVLHAIQSALDLGSASTAIRLGWGVVSFISFIIVAFHIFGMNEKEEKEVIKWN